MLQVTPSELIELEGLMRHAPKPYVRRKATALWNLAQGRSQREVASFLSVGRNAVGRWQRRFQAEGFASLTLRPGRGRPQTAQPAELETFLRQSPRNFGLAQTRWTLSALTQVVPSLRGFTASGAWRALRRSGLGYKRGQPLIHSPDPDYAQKKRV